MALQLSRGSLDLIRTVGIWLLFWMWLRVLYRQCSTSSLTQRLYFFFLQNNCSVCLPVFVSVRAASLVSIATWSAQVRFSLTACLVNLQSVTWMRTSQMCYGWSFFMRPSGKGMAIPSLPYLLYCCITRTCQNRLHMWLGKLELDKAACPQFSTFLLLCYNRAFWQLFLNLVPEVAPCFLFCFSFVMGVVVVIRMFL